MADSTLDVLQETGPPSEPHPVPALVLVWSAAEPHRVGEVYIPPSGGGILGREGDVLLRQRPGDNQQTGALEDGRLSRRQLRVRPAGSTLEVENLGKPVLRHNGVEVEKSRLRLGDRLDIRGRALFLVVQRPPVLRSPRPGVRLPSHPFGHADDMGIVGESPAIWALREDIAFVARRTDHVYIGGASGTGKELAANAIHRQSRRRGPFVARSAATFPESLIDAELFGNSAGYPNAGMPARPGVVGEADGGILFLDEIGEMPVQVQSHLLRLMDGGQYHRLGESRHRTADIRLIAATNRGIDQLKHDLAPRFPFRIAIPGLDQRPDDILLIAHHLLRQVAGHDPGLALHFFPDEDVDRPPRLSLDLVERLLRREWTTHVRELRQVLWSALVAERGTTLGPPKETPIPVSVPEGEQPAPDAPPSREVVIQALERHGGRQNDVWRALGLSNRYVLRRLLKKYDIDPSAYKT